jgi:hypothetical protein
MSLSLLLLALVYFAVKAAIALAPLICFGFAIYFLARALG